MLKADLHIHTKEDPNETYPIKYGAKEIIDKAAVEGYSVLSITNHDSVLYNKELNKYASKKGILLIPGIEKTIKGKHVLLYNVTQEQADMIHTVEDLENIKKQDNLIIAAHPFYPVMGLGRKLIKSIHLFDAIEHSFFYTNLINLNNKAIKIAKRFQKPIISNSDLHEISSFGVNYSFIDSKKDINSVINAVKNNKVKIVSKSINNLSFLKIAFRIIFKGIKKKIIK